MNPILANDIKAIVEKRAFGLNPETLDKIFTHNTTASLLGAGAGAGIGAIADKKHPWRGAGIGAASGAVAGMGASKAFPHQSQELNEGLVKHLLRQPAGRVLTNVISPVGYDQTNQLKDLAKKHSLSDVIKSIWNDKPIYEKDMLQNHYESREVPYRKAFDLEPRYGKDIYTTNSDKSISFNKRNPDGLNELLEVVLNPDSTHHHTMKQYYREDMPDGGVKYKDVWDWNFKPGARITHPQDVMRYFINRIANPQTIQGEVSGPEAKVMRELFHRPSR